MKSRTKIVFGIVTIAALLAVICYTSITIGSSSVPEPLPCEDPGNGGTAGGPPGDSDDPSHVVSNEPDPTEMVHKDPGNGGTAGSGDDDQEQEVP